VVSLSGFLNNTKYDVLNPENLNQKTEKPVKFRPQLLVLALVMTAVLKFYQKSVSIVDNHKTLNHQLISKD
jgi:hypothetical protein